MGQKVNPNGFRFGITKKHNSQWYADKGLYAKYLLEDHKIKKYLETFTRDYAIGKIEILRNQGNKVIIRIHTSKPGLVLGKDNANIDKLTRGIRKATKNRKLILNIDVIAIEKPELDAKLLAEDIAEKLENRVSYRVAQKWAIRSALRAGAKGIKTRVSGRLNGVEMARTEGYTKGEMRLHTLRQNIDYAQALAKTTYGIIGVKVWISKGEILDGGKK